MPFGSRLPRILSWLILAAGAAAFIYSMVLTARAYMPCPFWDEWVVVDGIANGKGPWSWSWLWAQSNEHRHVIPRLLIWLDFAEFGGKNISLFTETFLFQILHWAAISYVIERFTELPSSLKRTLQGLFAFCLFHPNQAENFIWAFQFSFVLPFFIGTLALIAISFFGRVSRPGISLIVAMIAPAIASTNLAGGLLIGPATMILAALKRLPRLIILALVAAFLVTAGAYLYGYHRSGTDLPLLLALSKSKDLFVYVLTYFGASWTALLPHKERITAFLSFACFVSVLARLLRKRDEISDFEWFLIAECVLMLGTALLTAVGRIQFGTGQAFASRYQTPAMLYWAGLGSLVFVETWKRWQRKIVIAEAVAALIIVASICTFPRIWKANIAIADERRAACQVVMSMHNNVIAEKKLYENPAAVEQARPFVLSVWHRH